MRPKYSLVLKGVVIGASLALAAPALAAPTVASPVVTVRVVAPQHVSKGQMIGAKLVVSGGQGRRHPGSCERQREGR